MCFSAYLEFRLLWLLVKISLLFALDGSKTLAEVSDDSTDMSKQEVCIRNYEQAEKRLYDV